MRLVAVLLLKYRVRNMENFEALVDEFERFVFLLEFEF